MIALLRLLRIKKELKTNKYSLCNEQRRHFGGAAQHANPPPALAFEGLGFGLVLTVDTREGWLVLGSADDVVENAEQTRGAPATLAARNPTDDPTEAKKKKEGLPFPFPWWIILLASALCYCLLCLLLLLLRRKRKSESQIVKPILPDDDVAIGSPDSKTNFIMRKSKERFLKNFKAIAEDGLGYFIPPKKKKSKSWSDCSPRLGTFAAPDRLYEWNKTHRNWHSDEPLYWDIKDPKLVRGNFYSKQLIKLAKEYKVEPIFVYVPASNERLLDPKMKSEFENFFGTKLLSVDAETSKKLYATGYANKTHMNLSGQKIFAEWLSNQLKGLY